MCERYLTVLEDNRFLTYGQIVAHAVTALRRDDVSEDVHGPLRHLIVDEYQDVNPAQEALVETLATAPVHLCVVGDDDQAVYPWRGSDVENIRSFATGMRRCARSGSRRTVAHVRRSSASRTRWRRP